MAAKKSTAKTEKATFAAGCFWHIEEVFRNTEGVVSTRVGFSGGKAKNPPYEMVCTGLTGHAESVEVEFNPKKVSYDKLLEVFWMVHNPTQGNRQGWDIGNQYRSVIFYHSGEQKRKAEVSKTALEKSGKYKSPITTQIAPAAPFYPAEEYHQKYLAKHGLSTCPI